MHCLAEIWQGYSMQRMVTSASLHGNWTSQDNKFELSSTLPFLALKSQHATKIKADHHRFIHSTVHQIKPLSVAKMKGNSGSGIISKLLIWWAHLKQISKSTAPVGQCCILPPGLQLCTVRMIQNRTKMRFGAKHWLPQTCSHLKNCLHTWPPQEYSLPCINIIFLCITYKKLKFSASCTCLKMPEFIVGRINTPPALITIVLITMEQKTYKDWAQPI